MHRTDTSGLALIEHWSVTADQGLMNVNTARAFRATCAQVLSVLPHGQTVDVRTLDVDEVLTRFQKERGHEFAAGTIDAYRSRFRKAVTLFLAYADDPTAIRAPASNRLVPPPPPRPAAPPPPPAESIEYPFPLRPGRVARLELPADLTAAEVERLHGFLKSLAVDK